MPGCDGIAGGEQSFLHCPPAAVVFALDNELKSSLVDAIGLLDRFGGNRKKVADSLGVSERTIYRKLKKLDLA